MGAKFCLTDRINPPHAQGFCTFFNSNWFSEPVFWLHEEAEIITVELFMTCEEISIIFFHLKDQMTVRNIFLCLWCALALFQSVRLIPMSVNPLWMLNRALQRLLWTVAEVISVLWVQRKGSTSVCLKWLKKTKVKDGVSNAYTDRVRSFHTRRAFKLHLRASFTKPSELPSLHLPSSEWFGIGSNSVCCTNSSPDR